MQPWKQNQIRVARHIFKRECEFLGSAVLSSASPLSLGASEQQRAASAIRYPKALTSLATPIPEVGFCGQSNVGKSSLIKALINESEFVKTSRKAGHTKTLNFFKLGKKVCLVDMPGYGTRSKEEWGHLLLQYFHDRPQLKRIFLLLDHSKSIRDHDRAVMKLLEELQVPYQLVLTKSDAFPRELNGFKGVIREKMEKVIAEETVVCRPNVIATSAKSDEGLDELRCEILSSTGNLW